MYQFFDALIADISDFLYSYLLIILLLAVGLYFTIRTRGIQFRLLPESLRLVGEKRDGKNSVSAFEALMVSTASRVGTGNIVGAANAIALGGSDLLCMAMVDVLLLCIAVAVFGFIRVGMIHESYQKLLQEGDYSIDQKRRNKRMAAFPGIYWCIVTAIYLGYSFYTGNWDRSWIIWPVAGVLFAACVGIVNAAMQKKES